MDADLWTVRVSSASRRYQSALQTQSEVLTGFEEFEVDGDGDTRGEFPCPFCSEYFDIIGLCIHIDDEHPLDSKNGVCPVCAMRTGADMVAHITLRHGNIFKMQRKRTSHKSGSHTTLSMLRRELRDGTLQSLLGLSSCTGASSNMAADPLLSSFILPVADDFARAKLHLRGETSSTKKSLDETTPQWKVHTPPLSVKDHEERAKRRDFVRELLLSTVLDEGL